MDKKGTKDFHFELAFDLEKRVQEVMRRNALLRMIDLEELNKEIQKNIEQYKTENSKKKEFMKTNVQKQNHKILRIDLLEEANRIKQTAQNIHTQVILYFIIILFALFGIWYLAVLDDNLILGYLMLGSLGIGFLGVCWRERIIRKELQETLFDILKYYDSQILLYQDLLQDYRETLAKTSAKTSEDISYLGVEIEWIESLFEKHRNERAQIVSIYGVFI
jgi:hypothetical protein